MLIIYLIELPVTCFFQISLGENRMSNCKRPSESYWQMVILRGALRYCALAWPGSAKLIAVHIPIAEPNTLAIMGSGSYFEPLITDEAFCMCLEISSPDQKNKDLK